MASLNPNNPDRIKTLSAVDTYNNPAQFRGIFSKASTNLGQPGEGLGNFEGYLRSGTQELAEAFVDRYFEKTGKLPAPEVINNFIGQNLTTGYAQKYITSEIPRDVIKSQMVDPFIDTMEIPSDKPAEQTPQVSSPEFMSRIADLYENVGQSEAENIRQAFAPSMKRAIEEEAAAGRLRSGVSYGRDSAIQKTRENEANAIKDLFSNIARERAGGELQATLADRGFSQQDKELAQRAGEFTKTLGLNRQKLLQDQNRYDDQMNMEREGIRESSRLGKLMADARKPGTLDYINTAFEGLNAVGNVAKAFKPGGF